MTAAEWRRFAEVGGLEQFRADAEVTHLSPPEGGLMPCCGLTPFEVPRYHRMTGDPALVTCAQLARNSDAQLGEMADADDR